MNHPLPEGTQIEAIRKTCACSGGKFEVVRGKITKIINNRTGIWYYLNTGVTISSAAVQKIIN